MLTPNSTGSCPTEWRAFWAAQSERDGTTWIQLITAAETALAKLRIVHAPKTTIENSHG